MDIELYKRDDPEVVSGDRNYHDIVIENGDIQLVDGADAVQQHLSIRMQTWAGTWKYDLRIGIPYLTDVLIKAPKTYVIHSIFEEVISETPGVTSVDSLTLDINNQQRKLSVNSLYSIDRGVQLVYDELLIIDI